MAKRGVIQSVYQEALTPKKEEEATVAEPTEENNSVEQIEQNGESQTGEEQPALKKQRNGH
jgi:hypothetical protein